MRTAPRNVMLLLVLGGAAPSCQPTPVALVFAVDKATLPPAATKLSVTVSVNDIQYQKADYDLPLTAMKDKLLFGLQLPDGTAGQLGVTIYPLTVSDQRISTCGDEYKWTTTTALAKGTTQLDVAFQAPSGAYANTADLYASWAGIEYFAVGAGGTVLRYDGTCWRREQSPLLKPEYTFRAIWGRADEDVWVAGDTTEGGTKKSVLLWRSAGVWQSRGEFPGTVTGLWGPDSTAQTARLWILGRTPTNSAFLYYHQRSANNTTQGQPDPGITFQLAADETIGDLTALYGDGGSLFVAAKVNKTAGSPYLIVYSLDETRTPPFSKSPVTQISSPLPHSIDFLSGYPGESLWMAGAKTAPTATSKITLRHYDIQTMPFVAVTVPDPMIDTATVRLAADNRSTAYVAKINTVDTAAPLTEPMLRCTSGGTGKCTPLAGQAGHFRSHVSSVYRSDDGMLWVTMARGGVARINPSDSFKIESFWAP